MALAKEDIEEIKELIVAVIAERRPEMAGNNVRYELEIRENRSRGRRAEASTRTDDGRFPPY